MPFVLIASPNYKSFKQEDEKTSANRIVADLDGMTAKAKEIGGFFRPSFYCRKIEKYAGDKDLVKAINKRFILRTSNAIAVILASGKLDDFSKQKVQKSSVEIYVYVPEENESGANQATFRLTLEDVFKKLKFSVMKEKETKNQGKSQRRVKLSRSDSKSEYKLVSTDEPNGDIENDGNLASAGTSTRVTNLDRKSQSRPPETQQSGESSFSESETTTFTHFNTQQSGENVDSKESKQPNTQFRSKKSKKDPTAAQPATVSPRIHTQGRTYLVDPRHILDGSGSLQGILPDPITGANFTYSIPASSFVNSIFSEPGRRTSAPSLLLRAPVLESSSNTNSSEASSAASSSSSASFPIEYSSFGSASSQDGAGFYPFAGGDSKFEINLHQREPFTTETSSSGTLRSSRSKSVGGRTKTKSVGPTTRKANADATLPLLGSNNGAPKRLRSYSDADWTALPQQPQPPQPQPQPPQPQSNTPVKVPTFWHALWNSVIGHKDHGGYGYFYRTISGLLVVIAAIALFTFYPPAAVFLQPMLTAAGVVNPLLQFATGTAVALAVMTVLGMAKHGAETGKWRFIVGALIATIMAVLFLPQALALLSSYLVAQGIFASIGAVLVGTTLFKVIGEVLQFLGRWVLDIGMTSILATISFPFVKIALFGQSLGDRFWGIPGFLCGLVGYIPLIPLSIAANITFWVGELINFLGEYVTAVRGAKAAVEKQAKSTKISIIDAENRFINFNPLNISRAVFFDFRPALSLLYIENPKAHNKAEEKAAGKAPTSGDPAPVKTSLILSHSYRERLYCAKSSFKEEINKKSGFFGEARGHSIVGNPEGVPPKAEQKRLLVSAG